MSAYSHKIGNYGKGTFAFNRLFYVGLILLALSVSACFEETKQETTTTPALDTEIKRAGLMTEYHHVEGCQTCHDATGNSTNIALIRHVINTPNSGPKTVVFTSRSGPNSFADGDTTYNGVCEVCHTLNGHHNNDGHDNTAHLDGLRCTQCHLHNQQFAAPHKQAHQTHTLVSQAKGPNIECTICHDNPFADPLIFADMKPLATTTVCDGCHSPSGSYPGVDGLFDANVGAKANFITGGIYNEDGLTLKPGKEKWCATCHDEQQSISNPGGLPTTNAPNVVGDNTTYGYFATGHGKSMDNCLECHDASKKHIDHEHRTYAVDDISKTVTNNWGDSYRLRTSNSKANEQLCIKCHDQNVLQNAGEQSNFKSTISGRTRSAHTRHMWSEDPLYKKSISADTDYNGSVDSRITCTVCHNVHGSKSHTMVKTGELASTPNTVDRTPGLNHTYIKESPGPFSTATWRPFLPTSGLYEVYAWWRNETITSARPAKYIIHYNGGSSYSVSRQQSGTGGDWVSLGRYPFLAGTTDYIELSAENSNGASLLADRIGIDTNGDTNPDIIIDDLDPEFSSIDVKNGGAAWTTRPWADKVLNNEERYVQNLTLAESTAGYVRFNTIDGGTNRSVTENKVCNNCHGARAYFRTPFTGPKVINRFEEKRWVQNDGSGIADIVVSVTDPDGDMAGGSVNIDVSSLGGGASITMANNGDGTFSYQIAIAPGTFDKAYNLPITATDGAGNVGTGTSSVFVKNSTNSIYLDNVDAVHNFADNWSRPPTNVKAYNRNYISTNNFLSDSGEDSQLTATWTTTIKKAGRYKIYTWLYIDTNFNKNATYTIQHRDGTTLVPMNQEGVVTTGNWELLGTFNYDAGATASITVGATGLSTDEMLFVDAIKLELIP